MILHSRWLVAVSMSSEDDDVVLQKHRGKLGTSLARPAVDKAVDDKASRRQSKESQSSKMSKIVSNSTQGRDVQPARKSATAALPDDDSDEDARMLEKHQHKLFARPKVVLFLSGNPDVGLHHGQCNFSFVFRSLPSLRQLRSQEAGQQRCKQARKTLKGPAAR